MTHVALVDPLPIVFVVRDGVRSRPHQAHRSPDDVEELRELVERGSAHQSPEPRDALIALGGLRHDGTILGDPHRSELEDVDDLPVEAISSLTEQDRARARQLDRDRAEQHIAGAATTSASVPRTRSSIRFTTPSIP